MSGREYTVGLAALRRARRGSSKPPERGQGPTVQTAVRLGPDLIARLDAVAAKLSRPGLDITRTDAIRICLETGLEKIERE